MVNIDPLLVLIRKYESIGAVKRQGVPSEYDVVFGGIKDEDRPQNKVGRYLTQLTVGGVLDWQDSIDPYYNSEAAGAYQVMEDTLRALVKAYPIDPSDLFNKEMQDRIAVILLNERGLRNWANKHITDEDFGDSLAREWASLPVMTGPKRGESYYGGVGANKHKTPCTPEEVLETLAECRKPAPSEELQDPENGATAVDYIVDRLDRIEAKLDRLLSVYSFDGKG